MRSRYSAFVRDDRDYLLQTWHPRTRPDGLEAPAPGLRWLGLSIRQHRQDGDQGQKMSFDSANTISERINARPPAIRTRSALSDGGRPVTASKA